MIRLRTTFKGWSKAVNKNEATILRERLDNASQDLNAWLEPKISQFMHDLVVYGSATLRIPGTP